MNPNDFNQLIGLLSKLNSATNKAARTDGSFQKYYTHSIEAIQDLPNHIKRLEQGLKITKVID